MAELSKGAWLGIGLACGFVIGIATYAFISGLIFRRKNVAPHPKAHSSSQCASVGGFTNIANEVRPIPPVNNLATSAPLGTQIPAEDMFYSPLQSCMVKSSNIRGSANGPVLPDPALYGSHGYAFMHIQPAASSIQPAALPQPDVNAARLPDSSVPVPLPPSTPTDKAMSQPAPLQSQQSGRDITDQGIQQTRQKQHQRMFSVADAYGADDLDDEWAVVLGDLDGLLAKKGQPGLASPERAVAVRRLIAVTGSRGMQFALEAALDDVMRYRSRK